ncbi:hypothetical protein XH99_28950 [Bradyrhizobium nanningense]|uniref:Uncharacterized protein n=1 Tax=Bradyrhizobium nanningense TaxID=1325118 RepID=A0A4Q0RW31_9BRAD|nr:hypothetical protein [Bradyrhizobium nanningense]RXH24119.1 hypothetical protein XH99_28950 [Bradyrhizobium nanningense]RXH29326.1 hypothetical protein XH84_22850 [Bradyrhizobium nanningense]
MNKITSFELRQRLQQVAHFDETHPDRSRYKNSDYRFAADAKFLNLAPSIRDIAPRYFEAKKITWHTHANHALSSQVCCLNFLMPLAERPEVLARLVRTALKSSEVRMLPVEDGPDGRPWYVAFEWNGGGRDFLNEAGPDGSLRRGSNSTSADAVVKFECAGELETLLIEWKYTEQYGAPISASGNPTRIQRYRDLAFAPNGPVRADLGLILEDFFWEPFYQLLRQQMLAFQMQKARLDGATKVRILHISPKENRSLHRVTAPALRRFGDDAFEVFRTFLSEPGDFINCPTEELFVPLISSVPSSDAWAVYLTERYRYLDGAD